MLARVVISLLCHVCVTFVLLHVFISPCQPLNLYLCESHSDDLCSELKLGAVYTVIGVAVPQDVEVPSWSDPSGHATMPVIVEVRLSSFSQLHLWACACTLRFSHQLFMPSQSLLGYVRALAVSSAVSPMQAHVHL